MTDRGNLFKSYMHAVGLNDTVENYINGQLTPGQGQKISLIDPFSGIELTHYSDAGSSLTEHACTASNSAQKIWMNDFSAAARGQVMQKASLEISNNIENLANLESIVSGKPLRDCRVEVSKVAEMFSYYGGWTDKLHGEVIPVPSGHLNYTIREPLGVIFQITPWNAPIFTAGWQIAPAIACGNGVVIKPSEFTPVTTVALVCYLEASGLPKGLVNVLCGLGSSTGQAAIKNELVRKVVFVGSPITGKKVAISASESLKPVVLELGGKSANIVFDDCNLEHACLGAQAAIFSGAGQSCVSGSRLLIQSSVYDELTSMISSGMQSIKLGDPLHESTEIGPISNLKQFNHIQNILKVAKTEGATVSETNNLPEVGYFVSPTVLTNLKNSSTTAQTEIFGPVVTAISFETEDEAISIANDTSFGLAGAVWTNNVGRAHRVASKVRAGTFWINSYKAIHVSSPFGGSLSSGFGRSSGLEALMEYTAPKSVWLDSAETPSISFGYVA